MTLEEQTTPHLNVERCLIIPDIHQDIPWLQKILQQAGDWDHCIFLGDYFDTRERPEDVASIEETAQFIRDFASTQTGKVTFLWGNHDIPYLEAHRNWNGNERKALPRTNAGVPVSGIAVNKIFEILPPELVRTFRLFHVINGYLLSHAGVAERFWPQSNQTSDSLSILEKECESVLRQFHKQYSPLLAPGIARGGEEPVGGLTWQCWTEFADSLPLPQIVGHTRSQRGARQNGRSWCLDGGQTCYGILEGQDLKIQQAV